jgi:hypothetical protein
MAIIQILLSVRNADETCNKREVKTVVCLFVVIDSSRKFSLKIWNVKEMRQMEWNRTILGQAGASERHVTGPVAHVTLD